MSLHSGHFRVSWMAPHLIGFCFLKLTLFPQSDWLFLVSSHVIEFWKHFYGSDMIQVWQWKGNFDWGIDRISIKFKPIYDFCFTLGCLISLIKNYPNEKKLIESKVLNLTQPRGPLIKHLLHATLKNCSLFGWVAYTISYSTWNYHMIILLQCSNFKMVHLKFD
jgi:hypothetical protein